jgi:hypothetical protein
MAELPYPAAYGPGAYSSQEAMAPPGFKVPLGGYPQGPQLAPQPAAAMLGPSAAAVAMGLSNSNML